MKQREKLTKADETVIMDLPEVRREVHPNDDAVKHGDGRHAGIIANRLIAGQRIQIRLSAS